MTRVCFCAYAFVPHNAPLQKYALDNNTLALIELAVFAVLEGKRYEIYKKTGEVGLGLIGICVAHRQHGRGWCLGVFTWGFGGAQRSSPPRDNDLHTSCEVLTLTAPTS